MATAGGRPVLGRRRLGAADDPITDGGVGSGRSGWPRLWRRVNCLQIVSGGMEGLVVSSSAHPVRYVLTDAIGGGGHLFCQRCYARQIFQRLQVVSAGGTWLHGAEVYRRRPRRAQQFAHRVVVPMDAVVALSADRPDKDDASDIWCRIHSLLPMKDGARAACNVDSWLQAAVTPGIEELTVQLSAEHLEVLDCTSLKVIEREAPNLSNFHFSRYCLIQISLGVALELKKLTMSCPRAVCYARVNLPSSFPNIEALSLSSVNEEVNTPMLPSKFLHLKYLNIDLAAMTFSPAYDYCSLISFLDASPSLETFILNVLQINMEHESVVGDTSDLRQMPGYHHENLKTVEIIGFSSAKSLVELTCHIIENTVSLECLTLDTTRGHNPCGRCSSNKSGMCSSMRLYMPGARKGLLAIKTYVEPKIPSGFKLTVVEPCNRRYDLELAGVW
ncbi:uncharacterized protein LOC123425648 [Hordeum vulgare subsp. vulgare]|nr:uncharacterized protein LOC123425648 [Hordeum vulgare subsp. vulgare]